MYSILNIATSRTRFLEHTENTVPDKNASRMVWFTFSTDYGHKIIPDSWSANSHGQTGSISEQG